MGNGKRIIALIILMLSLTHCSQEVKTDDHFVIEGYIYSDEPIKNIVIKHTLPITTVDTIAPPITDAAVVLRKNNQDYHLTYSAQSTSYFYPGSDLQVKTGDIFEITVNNHSRTATAVTTVPAATQGLVISGDKIHIPTIPLNNTTRDLIVALFADARLNVNWQNPGNELHFLSIESLDHFDPIFPQNFPPGVISLFKTFRYVSAPSRNTSFEIVGLSLETYGRYRVKVYRVNKEYADLYDNQAQDSRDLNQPPSNVTNAFGIFSAFASDSVFFEVVRN